MSEISSPSISSRFPRQACAYSSFSVVLAHHRRRVVRFNVTEHPTAQWTAQQIVDAFRMTPHPPICCGSRQRQRASVSSTREAHGYRGGPHRLAEPMAESLRGATHRLNPARMPGPCRRSRRASPSTNPHGILRLLSSDPHSPLAREGRSRWAAYRAPIARRGPRDSRSRRPASPLHPAGSVISEQPVRAGCSYRSAGRSGSSEILSARPVPGDADCGPRSSLQRLKPLRRARTSIKRAGPVLAKDRFGVLWLLDGYSRRTGGLLVSRDPLEN